MEVNTHTKLIARLHKDLNGTGLDIYNPYFQEKELNTFYKLFKSDDITKLISGIRALQIDGAITSGFEKDVNLPPLLDELDESSLISGRVGLLTNSNGHLKGYYQAGEALRKAIASQTDMKDKVITLVGSGSVAKAFLLALKHSETQPSKVYVVNRTVQNALTACKIYPSISEALELQQLGNISSDILINASRIGSTVKNEIYTDAVVRPYEIVTDVSFGNPNTELIKLATNMNKTVVDGWDVFTYQVAVVLKLLLNHDADITLLKEYVQKGLKKNNHGAIVKSKI